MVMAWVTGEKLVTTVVPFKRIGGVPFTTPSGSVTAHANVFVAPGAALNVPTSVHAIVRGACALAGFVVIAAVAGNAAITAAAFAADSVIVNVAGGASSVANSLSTTPPSAGTTGLNSTVAVASFNLSVPTMLPVPFSVAWRVTTPALLILGLFDTHVTEMPPGRVVGKLRFAVTSLMACPLETTGHVNAFAAEFTVIWSLSPTPLMIALRTLVK
jgi:hypothetical protein